MYEAVVRRGGVASFFLVVTRGNLNRAGQIPNKVATPDEVLGATRQTTVVVGNTI